MIISLLVWGGVFNFYFVTFLYLRISIRGIIFVWFFLLIWLFFKIISILNISLVKLFFEISRSLVILEVFFCIVILFLNNGRIILFLELSFIYFLLSIEPNDIGTFWLTFIASLQRFWTFIFIWLVFLFLIYLFLQF